MNSLVKKEKLVFFLVLILVFVPFITCYSSTSSTEEAEMHYRMATERYKNGNYSEASRLLNEAIGYYDPEYLRAYPLLIKV